MGRYDGCRSLIGVLFASNDASNQPEHSAMQGDAGRSMQVTLLLANQCGPTNLDTLTKAVALCRIPLATLLGPLAVFGVTMPRCMGPCIIDWSAYLFFDVLV